MINNINIHTLTKALVLNYTMQQQQKKEFILPYSGSLSVVIYFILHVVLVLPIWLLLLVPITLVYFAISKIINFIRKIFRKEKGSKPVVSHKAIWVDDNIRLKAGQDRPYDLILFGCTGFTGRLVR